MNEIVRKELMTHSLKPSWMNHSDYVKVLAQVISKEIDSILKKECQKNEEALNS